MPADFRDAADRHFEDAGFLFDADKFPNADHLFGLSAECALKAVMMGLGMNVRQDGAPDVSRYRVHINRLWDEFIAFANGSGGAKYSAGLNAVSNPFTNWDIAQRYNHRTDFVADDVERHKTGAEKAMAALGAAILDGVVS
jgi:hypothetical protein